VGAGVAGLGSTAIHEESTVAWTEASPSSEEMILLETAATGAWDRILPPEPRPIPQHAPKEAYNRANWLSVRDAGGRHVVPWLPIYRQ
jgi:hypothetical protein